MKNKLAASILLSTLFLSGITSTFLANEVDAEESLVNIAQKTEKVKEDKNIDFDLKDLFSLNGHAQQIGRQTARLTEARQRQAGTITGIKSIDMNHDFELDMDVFLGNNPNGADGIGIAFHQSGIGAIGTNGGGLGIAGLKNGIGFELDTFTNAPSDHDPSFGHNHMIIPHAGFVSTDQSSAYLTALAPVRPIERPHVGSTFKNLRIRWNSATNTFTANYEGNTWTLNDANVNKNERYFFTVGAATGDFTNVHEIRINHFDAMFEAPELFANDIEINQYDEFDPFDSRIGLKAVDKVDGDITEKITVEENNVDTSVPGNYTVTYRVQNSSNEVTRKTINVKVNIKETWPNGIPEGWKMFSGEDIELVKDPDRALVGDYTFFADQHASIYKHFTNNEALIAGKEYRATIYFKPQVNEDLSNHHVKLSLKADPSSNESRDIFNTTLANATPGDKGYSYITQTFTVAEDETNPLIIIENYRGGYIGSINVAPTQNQ
jgi:hypothetical protein